MSYNITSITEKVPQTTTLPDGIYQGIWGGYEIDLKYNDKHYILVTEEGVKGINIKVVVTVNGGRVTFDTINN